MGNFEAMMPEFLAVMKDMASFLEKQDATQEKAKLDKPPKTGEDQKAIIGGSSPVGGPAEGIVKEFGATGNTSTQGSDQIKNEGASLLKEDEECEEEATGNAGPYVDENEEEDEEDDTATEMKALLKDIATSLRTMQKSSNQFSKADLQKAVRKEAEIMLHKMGFNPSKPDIVRLGVDQTTDVMKGETEGPVDVKKSSIDSLAGKDLSGLSWRELNGLREQMGGFNQFGK